MGSPRSARTRSRGMHIRPDAGALVRWFRRSGVCVRWVGRKLNSAPIAIRIAAIAATVLAVLSATNFIYHVARKPTEMFSPLSSAFDKTPLETWRHYAPLFREYSTDAITPELLAALAQVESAGNPLASTYWRWHLTWHPFAIYQPASTSVGMYQMTDAAFAETLPSLQPCFWIATCPRFSQTSEIPSARSRSRNSPPSFISAVKAQPRHTRAAAFP